MIEHLTGAIHFVAELVAKFLLENGIIENGLDFKIIATNNNWKLITYNEYSNITGIPVKHIVDYYESCGFVFWSNKYKSYVICYNSDLSPLELEMTVLHEMAHLILWRSRMGDVR